MGIRIGGKLVSIIVRYARCQSMDVLIVGSGAGLVAGW